MNKYSIFKRTIVAFSFLVAITVLSSFGSGCFAGSAPNLGKGFEGSWTGEVKASGGNSAVVNLGLKGIKDKSTLTYESPRGCTLTVKFLKSVGDSGQEYSFTESSGGFCDKLLLGKLSVQKQGDNTLACEMTSLPDKSATKISEKGTLRRSGVSP